MVPLSAMVEQAAQHRSDLADTIARHDAETARRLAERDTLHLGHIERLLAQAAIERSLLVERVDAAEIRAEQATEQARAAHQRMADFVDRVVATVPTVGAVPWWRRWLGVSKRSDIG
jgi:hypothetical protein